MTTSRGFSNSNYFGFFFHPRFPGPMVTTAAGNYTERNAGWPSYQRPLQLSGCSELPIGIVVVDADNHRIRLLSTARFLPFRSPIVAYGCGFCSGTVSTLAGSGTFGLHDGSCKDAQFNYPKGICSDGSHLYVCDQTNHRIRQISFPAGRALPARLTLRLLLISEFPGFLAGGQVATGWRFLT